MYKIVKILSVAGLIAMMDTACGQPRASVDDPFFKQMITSAAFKRANQIADSLKTATGIPFMVSVSIVREPLSRQDSIKHLATGFIEVGTNRDDAQNAYMIKYDSKRNQIVSIEVQIVKF